MENNLANITIQLNEKEIANMLENIIEQRLQILQPRVLSYDINEIKRITGIKDAKLLREEVLSDPRILRAQFQFNEGGKRRWNARIFEEAYEELMQEKAMFY